MSVGVRLLGTMVTYGYPDIDLDDELRLARRIGASVLEILPMWNRLLDPALIRARSAEFDLAIHSAHGCWGGQSIRAARVDLGSSDPTTHRESIDDLKRCVDWLKAAGGTCLIVHPGGLSSPAQQSRRRKRWRVGCLCWPNMPRARAWSSVSRICRRAYIPAPGWRSSPSFWPSSIDQSLHWRSIQATQTSRPAPRWKPTPPDRGLPPPTSTTTTAVRIPTSPPAPARSTGASGIKHSMTWVTPGQSCSSASGIFGRASQTSTRTSLPILSPTHPAGRRLRSDCDEDSQRAAGDPPNRLSAAARRQHGTPI